VFRLINKGSTVLTGKFVSNTKDTKGTTLAPALRASASAGEENHKIKPLFPLCTLCPSCLGFSRKKQESLNKKPGNAGFSA
jgi:hypothetical protein